MDQFNNSLYAAIPGVRGQQPIPPPPAGTMSGPGTPPQGAAASLSHLLQSGPLLSGLRSDYMNNELSNADWQSFLPQGQGVGMQNHMFRPQPSVASQMMTGPYGRQAAQMAGLLGNPGQGYPTGGGLLGGPKGFRVPGGK
jgi:hypothetical protein